MSGERKEELRFLPVESRPQMLRCGRGACWELFEAYLAGNF